MHGSGIKYLSLPSFYSKVEQVNENDAKIFAVTLQRLVFSVTICMVTGLTSLVIVSDSNSKIIIKNEVYLHARCYSPYCHRGK